MKMPILSKTFMDGARRIANLSRNPDRAIISMIRIMRITVKMMHLTHVKRLFEDLQRKDIPTNTVGQLTKKLCDRMSDDKRRNIWRQVMKWKISGINKEIREVKEENTQVWRKYEADIESRDDGQDVWRKFEDSWNKEKAFQYSEMTKKRHKKVTFLFDRYKRVLKKPEDKIRGVKVADQVLGEEYESQPRMYGGTRENLQPDEVSLLSLPPKFTVPDKVDYDECAAQIEKAWVKLRWNRMNSGEDDFSFSSPEPSDHATNAEPTQTPPRLPAQAQVDLDTEVDLAPQDVTAHHIQGRAYAVDTVENTVDMRYLRPTDLSFNKRNQLPKMMKKNEEVKLQHLGDKLLQATSQYIAKQERKNTPDTGTYANLTTPENKGLEALQERKDTVIFQTDKSGRFSVDTVSNYKAACQPHTVNDEVITEEEHLKLQEQANAHSVFWTRMLQAGTETAESANSRIKRNMLTHDSAVAPLYVLRKDHKPCDDETLGPPTRPVCGASVAYNRRLAHLLSMLIKPIWRNNEGTCTSTEDMMASIQKVNERLAETGEDAVVISLDVKALYPSMDIELTADVVYQLFLERGPTVDGVDASQVGHYLALMMKPEKLREKGLADYCHTRKTNRGRPPTITGCAMREERDKRMKPWNPPRRRPDAETTRRMLAEALRISILFVMQNHVYKCDGVIRKQSSGGPIGLELTGDLAQVLMIWFDEELKCRVNREGHLSMMYERYVDDITSVLRNDWKGPGRPSDVQALERILEIGNGIHHSLQLTGDSPSLHDNGKMPTLDLGIWTDRREVSREETRSIVMHEFYAKEVSAKHVTHARSAMPTSMKRTVLTQELLRVMLRCSPLLEWSRVTEHLNGMMRRLQFSGYDQRFRAQVLKSAFTAYDNIKQEDAEGVRPMYRPKDWDRKGREEMKMRKRESWFREGGAETVIFVPNTPGSELKKRYEEEVGKSQVKVKIVESAGRSIKSMLQRSDPSGASDCQPPQKDECPVCLSGYRACRKEGVTYQINCNSCEEVYVGETADNAHHRGKQHADRLSKRADDSVLWKHVRSKHAAADPPPVFSMKVTGVFRNDALLRQVTEGNLINKVSGTCMNSRSEWNHQSIPRIVLADD